MKRISLLLAASTAALSVLAMSRDAHALGPVDVEAGAIVGGGSTPSNLGEGAPNPLGFGLGGRAGVGLFGFYGGLEGMYYFGSSQNGGKVHSDLYGIDVGANIKLPVLTIRPLIGIGNYTLTGSASGSVDGVSVSGSTSYNSLYLQPGVTVLVPIGILYVGADVNALLITDLKTDPSQNGFHAALTAHGQIGVTF